MRFDPTKVLLDPYGRGVVVPEAYSRDAARRPGRQRRHGDEERGGRRLRLRLGGRRAAAAAVLADHHLRDARARVHPASQLRRCRKRRAAPIAGLIEKIPYLQRLGITAVELLPVFQFDAQDCSARDWSTTGAMRRFRSSRRTRATARVRIRSARSTSFATWSRRCTGRASRSFSTSSSTTPPKATTAGRR